MKHVLFTIIINIYVLAVVPIFGEVTNTSQYKDPSHHTLSKKNVVKIEYYIDKSLITDSIVLSELQQNTFIEVGSQLSRYDIQRSIKSLYSLQQFSQINVYTVELNDGVGLKFEFTNLMHIQKIVVSGVQSDELIFAIRSAIRLEPGDLYVPESAESYFNSIKSVCEDYGYFQTDVSINTVTSEGELTYHINLGTPSFIKNIQIVGNTTIFSERIKEICQTDIGKIYSKSVIDEDIKQIRALYKKKYYPTITIEKDFNYKTGVLILKIDEGVQLLLDFVDVNGKQILQESSFRSFISKIGLIKYKSEKSQLRENITKLIHSPNLWVRIVQAHFESKGYDRTQVESKTLTRSPLHLQFTVKKGKRYTVSRVTFSGNTAFTEKELLREMDTKPVHPMSNFFQKRFFSQFVLERDIQRLTVLYNNAGYPNVEIRKPDPEKLNNNSSSGKVEIHITIDENFKEVINRVKFIGNSKIESTTLLHSLQSKPSEPNASLIRKKYENAIQKTYQDQGYLDVKVTNTKYFHKMDTPTFQVQGQFADNLDSGVIPKLIRDAFIINGHSLIGTYIATKIGDEWNIQDVDGNPRYTLRQQQDHLSVYEHGVLQFVIDEGDQVTFGKFFFVGDTGVKNDILEREVAHLPGTLYRPEKLNQVVANLNNTGIFEPGIRTVAKPTDIETYPIVKDVLIRLHKQKPRYIGASIGYVSSDGPRGTIAFSHLNLFKRNVRFRLRGRGGTRGYLYDTTLTQPWLINRTSASLQFLGRKLEQDDNVRALQGRFSLSRKLARFHRLNLEYSYRDLKDTSEDPFIIHPATTVSSLRFLWRQDNRFPALNPVTGMLNEVTLEYAGGYLGGRSTFIKTITDTRYYQKLNESGFVLATALRLGITTGLLGNTTGQGDNGEELISFERFYAGGSTTVRGYEERGLGPEDSTGKHRGNVQFIFNTELRFPILSPIHGVLFYDAGNVWGTIEEINYRRMPSSVGVGLRLNAGPIVGGVDYAVPVISVPDVPQNLLYLRFGTTF